MTRQSTPKSEETRARILEAALATFRERGFEQATMREIAAHAEVATGAAYYYFDSKDAIVMAFYQRSQAELLENIDGLLGRSRTFDARVRAIIQAKLDYFQPNRELLRALSAHIDPAHPLSPFSEATRPVREQDVTHFERAVRDSNLRLPKSIAPYLPRLLWLYQMGIVLFWLYDRSPGQDRTATLLDNTLKMLSLALRLAGLPIFRPMHRLAAEVLRSIYGEA